MSLPISRRLLFTACRDYERQIPIRTHFRRYASTKPKNEDDGTPKPQKRDLAPSSIFEIVEPTVSDAKETKELSLSDESKGTEVAELSPQQEKALAYDENYDQYSLEKRNAVELLTVYEPDTIARENFERGKIIEHVRNDWKINKEAHLKRTERSCTIPSLDFKTSVKKLGSLARQLKGKTVEEAILQMRFSKKRSAIEVMKHLEHARNAAIVHWGMGLGKAEDRTGQPVKIRLKDGSLKKVEDRTEIYIDQAWVGRRKYELEPEFRARGRTNVLRKPYTFLTLLLKEEATRVREHEEKVKKERNGKLWLHLPDRPVTAQRQHMLW